MSHLRMLVTYILGKSRIRRKDHPMNLKAIGCRIKTAREYAHLTQEDLAARTHLSSTHISCIERGVKPPKLDTFITIANALEVSSDVLLQDVLMQKDYAVTSELATSIHKLPVNEQRRIIRIVHAFSDLE